MYVAHKWSSDISSSTNATIFFNEEKINGHCEMKKTRLEQWTRIHEYKTDTHTHTKYTFIHHPCVQVLNIHHEQIPVVAKTRERALTQKKISQEKYRSWIMRDMKWKVFCPTKARWLRNENLILETKTNIIAEEGLKVK